MNIKTKFIVIVLLLQAVLEPSVVRAVLPDAPQIASFPLSDGFEGNALGPDWSSTVTGVGVAEIEAADVYSGTKSLFLGQRVAGNATAEVTLSMNLLNQTDVFLDFWWRTVGYAGSEDKGVFLSDDAGASWHKVMTFSGHSPSYSHAIVNVTDRAIANALNLTADFRIRIYYKSDSAAGPGKAGDGINLDSLTVGTRAQAVVAFPLFGAEAGFESNSFPNGIYPQSTGIATAKIVDGFSHGGTKNVFLGQELDGRGTAELQLVMDLTPLPDVVLDFWWRSKGYAGSDKNGIFISDDEGDNWTKVLPLAGNSPNYSHEVVNITHAAQVNSLSRNRKFRVRILYGSDSAAGPGNASDGLSLDDLRLNVRAQAIASFPLPVQNFELENFAGGIYPQSTGIAAAKISNNLPYAGLRHVYLGQEIAGNGTAALKFMLDLTDQTSVFLDFWWRSTGYAGNNRNGVFLSDDEGATWHLVKSLNGNSINYSRLVIDVAKEVRSRSLSLNNKFQIRIYYGSDSAGGSGRASDGLSIDNLQLSIENPEVKTYLPNLMK